MSSGQSPSKEEDREKVGCICSVISIRVRSCFSQGKETNSFGVQFQRSRQYRRWRDLQSRATSLSTVQMDGGRMIQVLKSSCGLMSCTIISGRGLEFKTSRKRIETMMWRKLLRLNVLLLYHLNVGVGTHSIVSR